MKRDKDIKQQPIQVDDCVMLPHDTDIEKDVLGSIIVGGEEAYISSEQYLTPSTFYDRSNGIIYSAIQGLSNAHKPIDAITLCTAMRADGTLESVGGVVYIANLTRNVSTTCFVKDRAALLRQYEIQRGLFVLGEKTKAMSIDFACDVQETIETVEKGLTELQMNTQSRASSMMENISKFYQWVEDNADKKNRPISTGLDGLDAILNGGFRAPDLIVIGGRPSMGKTQFAIHFTRRAAEQRKYVYFVSIEMTAIQLIARMVAEDGISYSRIRQGTLYPAEYDELNEKLAGLSMMRLNIADSPDCRYLHYIKSEARALKRKGELDMIVIDYLQLVRTNQRFEKRYIEVGYITGELKALAKELEVPVIVLAQLSRPASGAEREAPKMENLRESGDIEQDADIIIFPHRPYVYDNEACDRLGRSWKNRGMLLVEKNREGERNVRTYFMNDEQFKKFWDDEEANEKL